jgi:hypothetical protein
MAMTATVAAMNLHGIRASRGAPDGIDSIIWLGEYQNRVWIGDKPDSPAATSLRKIAAELVGIVDAYNQILA